MFQFCESIKREWKKESEDVSQEVKILENLSLKINRLNIDDMVKKYGVSRVIRVLAARILADYHDFDTDAIAIARLVPKLMEERKFERRFSGAVIHPAYAEAIFLSLVRLQEK